ncbi:hypothetical protein Purlil1_7516 [Purpureocillium lilacinum]|uniref:Uncharacterized protein n=1 Tax=Purpureocillium lilacinum TaxID=33203 RepID=A0ABR0BVG5_PURLI|nr:hypothetical protein Purlil1_7516 [Purpureocillium lilacinum]
MDHRTAAHNATVAPAPAQVRVHALAQLELESADGISTTSRAHVVPPQDANPAAKKPQQCAAQRCAARVRVDFASDTTDGRAGERLRVQTYLRSNAGGATLAVELVVSSVCRADARTNDRANETDVSPGGRGKRGSVWDWQRWQRLELKTGGSNRVPLHRRTKHERADGRMGRLSVLSSELVASVGRGRRQQARQQAGKQADGKEASKQATSKHLTQPNKKGRGGGGRENPGRCEGCQFPVPGGASGLCQSSVGSARTGALQADERDNLARRHHHPPGVHPSTQQQVQRSPRRRITASRAGRCSWRMAATAGSPWQATPWGGRRTSDQATHACQACQPNPANTPWAGQPATRRPARRFVRVPATERLSRHSKKCRTRAAPPAYLVHWRLSTPPGVLPSHHHHLAASALGPWTPCPAVLPRLASPPQRPLDLTGSPVARLPAYNGVHGLPFDDNDTDPVHIDDEKPGVHAVPLSRSSRPISRHPRPPPGAAKRLGSPSKTRSVDVHVVPMLQPCHTKGYNAVTPQHETNPAGQGRQTRTTTGLATQAMCVRRHPASLPRRRHFRSANKVASVYFGNTCPPLPDTPQTHLRDPEFQKKAPNPDAGTGTSAKRRQPTLRPDRPDDKPCHGP